MNLFRISGNNQRSSARKNISLADYRR